MAAGAGAQRTPAGLFLSGLQMLAPGVTLRFLSGGADGSCSSQHPPWLRLSHLEDNRNQPRLEGAGPLLPPIHLLAWGVGQIGGWVLLATAAGDLGAIVPWDRITLALNPSLKGNEREVRHSPACSSADSPLGRDSGSWGDTAVPCPQQRGTSGDLRMWIQPPPASLWEVMSRMLLCGCLTPWSPSVWWGRLSCTLRCVAGRLEEPLEAVTAPDPTQPCAGCN